MAQSHQASKTPSWTSPVIRSKSFWFSFMYEMTTERCPRSPLTPQRAARAGYLLPRKPDGLGKAPGGRVAGYLLPRKPDGLGKAPGGRVTGYLLPRKPDRLGKAPGGRVAVATTIPYTGQSTSAHPRLGDLPKLALFLFFFSHEARDTMKSPMTCPESQAAEWLAETNHGSSWTTPKKLHAPA